LYPITGLTKLGCRFVTKWTYHKIKKREWSKREYQEKEQAKFHSHDCLGSAMIAERSATLLELEPDGRLIFCDVQFVSDSI